MDGPRLEIDAPRPARQPARSASRPDRIDLPQRLRLGLDPQARRRADRGRRSRLPGRRWEIDGRAASTTSPPATTSATPAGAGRPGSARARDGRAARLEPGRGRSTTRPQQRAGDLDRRRAARARPGLLPAASTRSSSPTATRLELRHRVRATPATRTSLLVRSRYRHRFGSFSGSLGGVRLAEGFGVMEEHDARLVSRPVAQARCSGFGKSKRQPASHSVRWLPWAGCRRRP